VKSKKKNGDEKGRRSLTGESWSRDLLGKEGGKGLKEKKGNSGKTDITLAGGEFSGNGEKRQENPWGKGGKVV